MGEVTLQNIEPEDGFWRSCSGCHETADGHETGAFPWSPVFKCHLGAGCRECGGLGAVWDNTDYAHMGDWLAKSENIEPGCIECGGPLPGPSYAVCDTCLRSHAREF